MGRAPFIACLRRYGASFFHPPSETSPTNRSRAYHPDDDGEAWALTKFAREAPRHTEEVRRLRYRRKPIAGYAS